MKTIGLYIHIPFCRSKCIYCDFFSTRCAVADWDKLVDSLIGEMKERQDELDGTPDTIYIGGGTPSLIPPEAFSRLCGAIRDIWGTDAGRLEFTIEVNPEDVSREKCLIWKGQGVNRVSMGVQSFIDGELHKVGRRHDASRAKEAYYILRRVFDNISIDLMFGLPEQTSASWQTTIDEALALRPEHISAYSLMFEPRTAISVLRDTGRLAFPSEEESLRMWTILIDALDNAGYRRYEISNYSLPGLESVHNSSYWKGSQYLGIGPSAHSYDGKRTRRSNPAKIKEYMERFQTNRGGRDMFYEEELLCDDELMEEKIMLRLRMREGIDMEEFSVMFGMEAARRVEENSMPYIKKGMLKVSGNNISLTKSGIMVSDDIILDLCM